MKKICCILLCLLLSLSVIAVPSFAAQENPTEDVTDLEAAIALGLFDQSALTRAQEEISRGEFVDALMRLCGMEIAVESSPFSDLTASSTYYNGICSAYALGYINGHADGTFREADPVAKSTAARLLTYAVGYKELLDAGLDYAAAAVQSEICSHSVARDESTLSVLGAAQMLLDAGNAYVVQINAVGDNLDYYFGASTVLEKCRGIYRVKGVVEANEFTYLNMEKSLGEGMVKIGDELLYLGETCAETFLGYQVTAYYKCDEASNTKTLLHVYEKGNEVLTIKAEDYVDYANGRIKYFDEKENVKDEYLALSVVDVIYNNKLLTLPKKEDFEMDNGTITLIDNDRDGEYDVVKILCYQTFVIDSVDKNAQKVFGKWGGGMLDFLAPRKFSFTSQDGDRMHVTELAEWDVLSVSKSRDGEVVTVIYATDWAEGEITAYSEGDNASITVDGKTYALSAFFITHQGAELKLGVNAMVLLDADGKVAAANFNIVDEKEYAYLIKTEPTGSLNPGIKVKYMDGEGKIRIADMAKVLIFNGQSMKTEEHIDTLKALSETLMICRVNANGQLDYIDMPYTERNGTITDLGAYESIQKSLCKFYDGHNSDGLGRLESLTYKTATRVFGYKLAVAADTKVFVVPSTPGDDDDYHVFSPVGYFENDIPYTVQGYRSDPNALHAEALIYRNDVLSTSIKDDTPVSVVEKVTRMLDADGNPTYKFAVYSNAARYEYYTKDDSVYTGVTFDSKPYKVTAGDVVRLSVDVNGKITACELVYSQDKDSMNGNNPNSSGQWATFRAMKAFVYQKYKNNFITTTTPLVPGTSYEMSTLANVETRAFSSYWQILVFDSERKQLSVGTAEAVLGYMNTGGVECSKVFVYDRRGDARIMVVYK